MCLVSTKPTPAQATAGSRERYVTVSVGVGGSSVTMRRDTVLQGSPQVGVRFATVVAHPPRWFAQVEAAAAHEFGAGDCIPGFTVCAPPLNLVSLSVAAGIPLSRDGITRNRRSIVAGMGAYRVIPSWNRGQVRDATAPGFHAAIELPVWRMTQRTVIADFRGVVVPRVHGQTAWLILVGPGIRD
jgi:hypothetical protein